MSSAKNDPNCREIDADDVGELIFTANGEYLVGGGDRGVQVWRVKDGKRVATMEAKLVRCVAVSKDGRFIAAGSLDFSSWHPGGLYLWDATDYKQVFSGMVNRSTFSDVDFGSTIEDVDFSPDSTRLVSASGCTATIWNIASQQGHTLEHCGWIDTAKYSPQGDRIATAGSRYIQIWNSNGHLLVGVEMEANPRRGLLWFNTHLLVKTKDSIKQIDASTGLTISEWSVPRVDYSSITLLRHAPFVAYATKDNITFWGISEHTQLDLISQSNNVCSTAFSPDDRLLAIVLEDKIIVKDVFLIKGPDIHIENAVLDAWKHDQLANAEALLTAAISTSKDTAHHILASRALVRARLRQWDAALVDAEKSIKICSSVVGYIAKFVALVGKGEMLKGCRVCDIAFQLHSDRVPLLLLIKATVLFMAGEHEDAMSRIDDLIPLARANSTLHIVQAYMHLLLGNSHMESGDYERAIQSFEDARAKLGDHVPPPLLIVCLISGWKFDGLALTIQQRLCEALLSAGRINEAGESVLRMIDQDINMTEPFGVWVSGFVERYPSMSNNGSATTVDYDNVSRPVTQLLREWTRSRLTTGSWKDALSDAAGFVLPRFTIYRATCECLETTGRVADAVACFHQMCSELGQEVDDEQTNWTRDFKSRCCRKLEDLGDSDMDITKYDKAISHYTAALSVNPGAPQELLGKRSKAYAGKAQWEDALNDASQAVELDPSFPSGYERKHAALHGMKRYDDAIHAFETMMLKISQSSNPEIRERSRHYVSPDKTKETIRRAIDDAIRDLPTVLIHTTSGRLYDKSGQISAFETNTVFTELISSTTTHLDIPRIQQGVRGYYRYATFSHRWEANEPLFEKVVRIVVYDLEKSPAHEKLKMFCKIVEEAGFKWAWSDTCCINKGDHFVLQEALVSMFKWYECSSMTVIYLLGVGRLAKWGALTRSIWNMRAWTLQEYHASKVVRIYTEDWTPYLGLTIDNHKDSPEIISEMEEATGIPAQALTALHPGLDDIREKLRLASTRETTRVEDAAYSLLGIFSISLPITYGEGDGALGRLLAQVLASSGDTSILAWTGISGSFNSCLPSNISVFSQPSSSHIPPAIPEAEMERTIPELGSHNLGLVTRLYDRVNELLVPSFSGRRMRLPCLTFKLGRVSVSHKGLHSVFRAKTDALGIVEIRTQEDISQLGSLTLVHPWIDFLLDRLPVRNVIPQTLAEENNDDASSVIGELPSFPGPSVTRQTRRARLMSRMGLTFGGRSAPDSQSLPPPSYLSPAERRTNVLRFLARLQRPFGALLLTPTRLHVEEYKRIAAESVITVQVQEITPAILEKLTRDVRMLDVL